jgi:hypothetical protein
MRKIKRRTDRPNRQARADFVPRKKRLLYKALEAGMPVTRACDLVGMKWKNYLTYIGRGKESGASNQAYRAFLAKIKRIEARKEKFLLEVIDKVAEGNFKIREIEVSVDKHGFRSYKRKTRQPKPEWKAAAWRLERRYPEEYAPKTVDGDATSPEEIARELKAAADTLFGSIPTEDQND